MQHVAINNCSNS